MEIAVKFAIGFLVLIAASLLLRAAWLVWPEKLVLRIKNEIRWRRSPLVYIWEVNGVTAVALAKDCMRRFHEQWMGPFSDELPHMIYGNRQKVMPSFNFGKNDTREWKELLWNSRVLRVEMQVGNWGQPLSPAGLREAYEHIYGKRRGRKFYTLAMARKGEANLLSEKEAACQAQ